MGKRQQTHDLHGRPYLTAAEATPGMVVQVDDGFTCIGKWQDREIQKDADGLWIKCRSGRHYMDGQLSDDGKTYVGVYRRNSAP